LFSFIEYDVTAQTAADPSGAMPTLATRSSCQRVSMSMAERMAMGLEEKAAPDGARSLGSRGEAIRRVR
jgi:hypothetical protein